MKPYPPQEGNSGKATISPETAGDSPPSRSLVNSPHAHTPLRASQLPGGWRILDIIFHRHVGDLGGGVVLCRRPQSIPDPHRPEHFTVWHYRIPFTQDYTLLGIAYAFGASASPGIVLGMALFILAVSAPPKDLPLRLVLSTAWVWLGVEIVAIAAGIMVHLTARPLYPEWVYPDDSHGLLITQTIQITAYLSGAVFSLTLLIFTWWSRGRKLPA